MTRRKRIYRCSVCGNIVEVLHPGIGKLVCCGKPVELLGEKSGGPGSEKYKVPIVMYMVFGLADFSR